MIDEWAQVSLDTGNDDLNEKVKASQIHNHRDSCWKKKGACRFNFPRPPSAKTIIAKPLPDDMPEEEKNLILEKAQFILALTKEKLTKLGKDDESMTIKDFVKSMSQAYKEKFGEELTEEHYHNALSISERGKTIILKRNVNEIMVNNYNPLFIRAWNANCDLQLCLDNYSVITYITDYFSKGDAGMTKLLRQALKEKNNLSDFEFKNYLKKVFFTSRQVCVSEATYNLVQGLDLKSSNITTKYVDTSVPEKRSSYFRWVGEDDELEEDHNESDSDVDNNEAPQTFFKEGMLRVITDCCKKANDSHGINRIVLKSSKMSEHIF